MNTLAHTFRLQLCYCIILYINPALASPQDIGEGCLYANKQNQLSQGTSFSAFEEVSKKDRIYIRSKLDFLLDKLNLSLTPTLTFQDSGGFRVIAACNEIDSGSTLAVGPDGLDKLKDISAQALDVVLAHELAHLIQFSISSELKRRVCNGTFGEVKTIELLADLAAGYIMLTIFQRRNPTDLILTISSLAEYEFSNKLHHGMVNERVSAFNFGQLLAFSGKPLDMKKLMNNKKVFLELVSGPPANLGSLSSYNNYYKDAMERIYK
ncbi:MAG TPA: hypothetical protein ENH82_04090 [bacterium]|nr:hypothetical protein [bacterium]